jgi:hypothetical protein
MSKITYVTGDATYPQGNKGDIQIIMHICNDKGAWGAGFVIAVSKRWKEPEQQYRKLKPEDRQLGMVQIVQVEKYIFVANMIAQHDIVPINKVQPIRYDALKQCLESVNAAAEFIGATVHAPLLGSGLAGGKWDIIEALIEECITVPVTIYVLDKKYLPQKGS